jgi:hypothetical protein
LNNDQKKSVSLRKHPFPYLCALTICSDIDRTSFDDFVVTHRFFNTYEATPFGPGLGLEIGNSFWMYSAGSTTDNSFTYFEGLSGTPSKHAYAIGEGIAAGYLDCLHTYGHFNQFGGFRRRMAEVALRELSDQGLKVKIWINHGDGHNFQNLLRNGLGDLPMDRQASGDLTPVSEYHSDLMCDYGIDFSWIGDNTKIIGQDRKVHSHFNFKQFIKKTLGNAPISPSTPENQLLTLKQLRDGRTIFTFARYLPNLRWGQDFGDDLQYVFESTTLDTLEEHKGFMIVYAHLGKKRQNQIFTDPTVLALRDLAERYQKGKIWVSTSEKILQFNRLYHHLQWSCQPENGRFKIVITGLNDSVGTHRPIKPEDLSGLCWYTPVPEKTEIYLQKKTGELAAIKFLQNPADFSGMPSVSLPLVKLDPRAWTTLYKKISC